MVEHWRAMGQGNLGALMSQPGGTHENEAITGACGFVRRLRRVAAHSVARDWDHLAHLESPKLHARIDVETGRSTLTTVLQREEAIESLAARIRPLILSNDSAHYARGLNCLSRLAYLDGQLAVCRQLREFKRRWRELDPTSTSGTFYVVQAGHADDPDIASAMQDSQLALAWFYGDVVHADLERHAGSSLFGIEHRFEAATLHVARLAGISVDTLNFVRWLHDESLLELPSEALAEQVTVERGLVQRTGQFYSAPVGAETPENLNESFGPDWIPGLPMNL